MVVMVMEMSKDDAWRTVLPTLLDGCFHPLAEEQLGDIQDFYYSVFALRMNGDIVCTSFSHLNFEIEFSPLGSRGDNGIVIDALKYLMGVLHLLHDDEPCRDEYVEEFHALPLLLEAYPNFMVRVPNLLWDVADDELDEVLEAWGVILSDRFFLEDGIMGSVRDLLVKFYAMYGYSLAPGKVGIRLRCGGDDDDSCDEIGVLILALENYITKLNTMKRLYSDGGATDG